MPTIEARSRRFHFEILFGGSSRGCSTTGFEPALYPCFVFRHSRDAFQGLTIRVDHGRGAGQRLTATSHAPTTAPASSIHDQPRLFVGESDPTRLTMGRTRAFPCSCVSIHMNPGLEESMCYWKGRVLFSAGRQSVKTKVGGRDEV